jgi:excisionase family DNA binding protein
MGLASPLLTVDDVAAWLSVSRQAVYKRVARQQLPGARYVGRRLYFHRRTLVDWLHQNRASSQTGEL